ncbi:MAG: hypothetical protein SOX32_01720 [Candidatus Choladocola sp.]|nr:hypothetical protein [Candidatus Choladocola sp.]
MNGVEGNLKFWGRTWLEGMGMAVAVAIVMFFLFAVGESPLGDGGFGAVFLESIPLLPWYLYITGSFIVLMITYSCFQIYFPLLLSMSVTRKKIIYSILCNTLAMIFGIILVSAVLWKLFPGDVSDSGLRLLPLLSGVFLAVGAVSLMIGIVVMRWGTVGFILMIVLGAVFWGCLGAASALGGRELFGWAAGISPDSMAIPVAGGVLYLAAAVACVRFTKKAEVRI